MNPVLGGMHAHARISVSSSPGRRIAWRAALVRGTLALGVAAALNMFMAQTALAAEGQVQARSDDAPASARARAAE